MFSCLVGLCSIAVFVAAMEINKVLKVEFLERISLFSVVSGSVIFVLMLGAFLLEHKAWRGCRYFFYHWSLKGRLERQMVDAGFSIQRAIWVDVPKIKLFFNKDFSAGTLIVRNSLRNDKKLDNVIMSSALRKFVVESHYQSDDGNTYIYELIDGAVSYKLTFHTFQDFLKYNDMIPDYKLFLDARTVVKLQHILLVGLTGSGKTYELYCLILQMKNKVIPYEIYFADPKGSSLAVLGQAISLDRTAVGVDEILDLLREFVEKMRERKMEMRKLLERKLDADYSNFRLSPYIFICDEYASLSSVLQSCDKKREMRLKVWFTRLCYKADS